MKKKFLSYFIIFIFIAALFLPQIIFFFVKDSLEADTSENRVLAEMPVFSLDTVEEFPSAFDNYWNDHVPFRNALKKMWSDLNFILFGESTTTQVTVGKNDGDRAHTWLFLSSLEEGDPMSDVRGTRIFTQEEKDSIYNAVLNNTQRLAEKDISLFYLLIPNKGNVYKEKLPDSISILNESSRTEELSNWMTAEKNVSNFIYIKDALLEAKNTADVYFRQDTHWNSYGAFIGFKEITMLAEPELKYAFSGTEVIIPPEKIDSGDLKQSLNISYPIMENVITVDGFLNECSQYKQKSVPAEIDTIEITANPNAPVKKTLLFIGDSFRLSMQPYFSKAYQRTVFLHKDIYTEDMLEQYKPDVIIYEAVERFTTTLSNQLITK